MVYSLGSVPVNAEESAEMLNCLCRCLEPKGGQFGCGYDTKDKGWSPSCSNLENGPCICKAYGCFRGKLPSQGECYTDCQKRFKSSTTSTTQVMSSTTTTIAAGNATEAIRKCNDLRTNNPTLTLDEFINYLKFIEQQNKGFDWKKIIAKLHFDVYGDDVDRTTPLLPIRLFVHGEDTKGYEKVNTFCRSAPKFVIDKNGSKIDISHSYAGLRSDLNRDFPPWMWLLRNFNTDWGDTWQVIMHFDSNRAPPDQRRGNKIGKWLAAYYSKPENKGKNLSQAYAEYFNQ